MMSDMSREKKLLTDVYKVTKPKSSSRNLKRHCQDWLNGCLDSKQSCDTVNCIDSKSEMTKGLKRKEGQSTSMNDPLDSLQQKCVENATTPVAVKERRIRPTLANADRRKLRSRVTPRKRQILEEEILQSPLSSSSSSPNFSIFRSPLDSGSPICYSSPGRNYQSSQESAQDVIWNCASPVNYRQRLSAHDSSDIHEFCRKWEYACSKIKANETSQHKTLLDVWQNLPCKESSSIENKNEKQMTRKTSGSASQEMKELLGKIENSNTDTRTSHSPERKRTPVNAKEASPNSSLEELWGEEDESLIELASQMSQALFEDTQCEEKVPTTPINGRRTPKTTKNCSTRHSTPVSQKLGENGSKEIESTTGSDFDEFWDDDSEVFSQEVFTLMEQQITETSSVRLCTPEEIERKKQDAVKKRLKNSNTWNGRLRVLKE